MFKGELAIVAEKKDTFRRFHPVRYWISPSLSKKEKEISHYVDMIQRGTRRTFDFGGMRTLHIGSYADVVSNRGSQVFFISDNVLKELAIGNFGHFQVSPQIPQCVSLCLNDLSFVASGFERKKFTEIVESIVLLGGEFLPLSSVEKADVYITNCPILPPPVALFSQDLTIVTENWANECFAKREKVPFDEFLIKPFQGIVLSSSDLEITQSKKIKQIVVNGGGIWKNTLDETTSFLLSSKISSTPKIKLALDMSIPIVRLSWVEAQASNLTSIEPYVLNFWCLKDFKISTLFHNMSFSVHMKCDNRENLIDAIKANGGSFSTPSDYLIVPHLHNTSNGQKYVTSSWIWTCIVEKKIINPNSSVLYRPFPYTKISKKLNGFTVVLYKMMDPLRYELTECLRSLGVVVHYRISDLAKVIVTIKDTDESLYATANKYNIKVVGVAWAQKLISTGKIPPIEEYILQNRNKEYIQKLCEKICQSAKYYKKAKRKSDTSLEALSHDELCYFSDDEEINTSPRHEITYETTSSRKHRHKTKTNNDPLFELISQY